MATRKNKQSTNSDDPRGRRRFGWQDQQEAESLAQLRGLFAKLGWNAIRPEKDLGEDFLVQIYDDGRSSGLSFYVQLKSIRDQEPHKSKRAPDVLRYPLEVKDIEHWEVQSPPVVLIVWDVEKQHGYWETIPRVIETLDAKGKDWRKKISVTARVPMVNGTDEGGMQRLRWAVARILEPIVPKLGSDKMKFSFSFPSTPDGIANMRALEKALDEGGEATIDGAFIRSFRFPAWHERAYGQMARPESVLVKPSLGKSVAIRLRVEVESDEGCSTLPYVEMRKERGGRRKASLTNEHQDLALVVRLELDAESKTIDMQAARRRPGRTVFEEREAVAFLLAFSNPGSTTRVFRIDTESTKIIDTKIKSTTKEQELDQLRRYYGLIDKLCTIQQRMQRVQASSFSLNNEISADEATTIEDIFPVIAYGRIEKTVTIGFPVDPSKCVEIKPSEERGRLTLSVDAGKTTLLGVEIDIGPVEIIVKDRDRFIDAYRTALTDARKTGNVTTINLSNMDVVEEYLNWLPRSTRGEELNRIAAEQSGYFTLDQALVAGYSTADTLKAEEHIHDCGGNVFRLLQYPASDHEDLLVTWLQSGKQGVFSHDTALALHQVSDILPLRQHITVPAGWTPAERLRLSPNVVLHEGSVEPSDITWMGPVPFTKLRRTLADCIEKGLTPDLIRQGIENARKRGLISHDEAAFLRLANVKSA